MVAAAVSRREVLAYGLCAAATIACPSRSAAASGNSISVPLDHENPRSPRIALGYEWGAPHRPDRRTVLLVADAQQFYLRPGAAADLQAKLFGNRLNVLALFGRVNSPELLNYARPRDAIDWSRAARVLNVHQWIADLKAVADALNLSPEKLTLYGRSGGADMVLRFVATHPTRVARAYVQAAVTHDLAARWGVSADHFWEELTAYDQAAAQRLAAFVTTRPDRRREAMLLLQRQNFYEPLDGLQEARVKLIQALLNDDGTRIADYRSRYQLDSLEAMRASGKDLSPVRIHEFARAYADPRGRGAPLRPDIESIFYYAEPMTRSIYGAAVQRPYPPLDHLRASPTEILIVAGRHDHTSDYRTQIGLAGIAPRSELLLFDDDHVFKRLTESGRHPALLQAFLADGLKARSYEEARDALAPLRWNETR